MFTARASLRWLRRRPATGDYSELVRLLLRIKRLMTRLGRQDEFAREIEDLRSTFKRKRNFLKLLDEKLPTLKGS